MRRRSQTVTVEGGWGLYGSPVRLRPPALCPAPLPPRITDIRAKLLLGQGAGGGGAHMVQSETHCLAHVAPSFVLHVFLSDPAVARELTLNLVCPGENTLGHMPSTQRGSWAKAERCTFGNGARNRNRCILGHRWASPMSVGPFGGPYLSLCQPGDPFPPHDPT